MKRLGKYVITFVVLSLFAIVVTTQCKAATAKKSGDYSYRKMKNGVIITEYTGKAKKVNIPSKIAGKKVVEIGFEAFRGNEKIKSVKMPDTITSINVCAFEKCNNLEKVTMSKNIKYIGASAFRESGIVTIKIPGKVKELDYNVFKNCKNLKKVTLGENVKIIQDRCFENCTKLEKINLENVEDIRDEVFKKNISLKGKLSLKNVVEIHDDAFYGCTGITEVEFSDSLQLLGTEEYDNYPVYAEPAEKLPLIPKVSGKGSGNPFAFCDNIEKFEVDVNNANYKTVDGIIYGKTGQWLVAWPAKKGGAISIGENVIGISRYAFSSSDISSLILNNNLNYIGREAFAKSLITEVQMSIPDTTMRTQWSYDAFKECKQLKKVVFPEGIKESYDIAFIKCTALTEVVLPESMTEISPKMFLGCEKLETVKLPKNVVIIPATCFYGCKSLKNINLENVDDIHVAAFYDCDSFSGVLNLYVTEIQYGAFGKCDNISEVVFNKGLKGLCKKVDYDFYKEMGYDYKFIDEVIMNRIINSRNAYNYTYSNPFAGCTKLEAIRTNADGEFKSVDGVLFSNDLKILISYPAARVGKYNIPYGTMNVGIAAFEQSALSEVVCSNTVTGIGNYAFCNTKINEITISKSVAEIGGDVTNVFEGSNQLESIKVHASNDKYESIDGVLFRNKKKGKVLEVYPAGKKGKRFEVPQKTYINENAFNNCVYLKQIYITDMKKRGGMSYGVFACYVTGCSDVKIYLAENFKPSYIIKYDKGSVFVMGFENNCVNCKTYVKKKSSLAKMLDKKKIRYNVY